VAWRAGGAPSHQRSAGWPSDGLSGAHLMPTTMMLAAALGAPSSNQRGGAFRIFQ
jgi:hypothetical protein